MVNTLTAFNVTGDWRAVVNPNLSSTNSALTVEPMSGLVHFHPRLPKGFTFWVNDMLIQSAYSSLQTIYLLGQPNSGTFKVQHGGVWTPNLAYNVTAAQLKTALEALPSIGGGNVTVTAALTPQAWDVRFQGGLIDKNVDAMVADGTALRNSSGYRCGASVTRTSTGGPQIVADTAVALSTITGRIDNGRLSAINRSDSLGVELTANTSVLQGEMWTNLMYDVEFTRVRFNGEDQFLAPFAFKAPTTNTPVCITDPDLVKHPYDPVEGTWSPVDQWKPQLASVTSMSARRDDWRSRESQKRRRTA